MGICCCPNHQAITYSVARVVITSTAITREEENCAVMSTRNLWSLSTFLGKSRCFEGAQRAFLSAQSKYIFDLVSPKANGFRPAGSRSVSLQVVAQRMKSVGNIQKITAAMKMVAASRLKGDVPGFTSDTTMLIPISSDKGLCGGINSTVVKVSKAVSSSTGGDASLTIIGEKARGQLSKAFSDNLKNVILDVTKMPLSFSTASLVTDKILSDGAHKYQIIYNRFQSVISFKPTVATVLSAEGYEKVAESGENSFDEYELEGSDRSELLLDLAEFKFGAVMYNALLENSTSELGSRMQSMENSTKNAKDMLGKLTLLYNRTRQASITTELIEIISGASALEE